MPRKKRPRLSPRPKGGKKPKISLLCVVEKLLPSLKFCHSIVKKRQLLSKQKQVESYQQKQVESYQQKPVAQELKDK